MTDPMAKIESVRIENRNVSYFHPSYLLERELDTAMRKCDREKSLDLLKTINSLERARLSDSPLQSLRFSLVASCTCYTRTAIHAGVDSENAFDLSDYFIREIGRLTSEKSLLDLEITMVMDFITLIERNSAVKISDNPTVERIIRYIKKNITHKLTLKDISGYINLHSVYVSSLFSSETGTTISDFIDSTRIESIKEFLTESDMKMVDIAELFSFSSAAHFSYYFKKHTGLTPKEYRSREKISINM